MTETRSHRRTRPLRIPALPLATASLASALALHFAGAAAGALPAHVARSLSITDESHLHYVKESGTDLVEEGQAKGGLPGTVRVRFNVGATVYASFSISTRSGSISGTGSGSLHGTGAWASFGGTMKVTHGTGRYTHAHGHGGFYGAINRHTYAAIVQTTGTLTY